MTTMWLIPERPLCWLPASTEASAGPAAIAVTKPTANVRTRRKDRDISCLPPKTPYPCARKRLWECRSAREKRKRRPGYGLSVAVESLIAELVAIESVNPDLVASGSGETAIAQFVASWLRDAGLDVEIVEPIPGRPSVVGVLRGRGGGPSLMLNAHMDTVGAGGRADALLPVGRAGRVYRRGACGM